MAGSNSGGSGSFYSGLPRMQVDSASNSSVASSFAALRNRPTQPMIADNTWHGDDPEGFHQRFAVGGYYLPGEPRTKFPGGPASNASSSMAVAINQSQYSSYAPSLAGYSEATLSSESSLRTSNGSSALSRYQAPDRLEQGDDGMLSRPDVATLPCPYSFLRCNEQLDSMEAWERHCQSHFRGTQNLPKYVQCPFRDCSWCGQGNSGVEAWRYWCMHLGAHHARGGTIDTGRRPDPCFIEHLWRIDAISDAQKKQLRTTGYLSGQDVYLESANSSRDHRRRERPRGGGRDPRNVDSSRGSAVLRRS